jgi:hypothetical protein
MNRVQSTRTLVYEQKEISPLERMQRASNPLEEMQQVSDRVVGDVT